LARNAKRRQAAAGNDVISARAITSTMLRQLYEFNLQAEAIRHSGPGLPVNSWGSAALRRLLHCLYMLSFWCLLRYDEALRIRCEDVRLEPHPSQPRLFRLCINIPFRKTDQLGGERLKADFGVCVLPNVMQFLFRRFTILPLPSATAPSPLPSHCLLSLVQHPKNNSTQRQAAPLSAHL